MSEDTSTTPGLTLLIVDDSKMMRMMIKRVAGVIDVPITTILEAGNGEEALAILESTHVDALFTDVNMPVMTGPELLREIDRRGRWPHLLRIVISTDGSTVRREEATALGVHGYVEKPVRPEVLSDVFSQLAPRTHVA